jgi:apolipoprotein D and lipocalin family protein
MRQTTKSGLRYLLAPMAIGIGTAALLGSAFAETRPVGNRRVPPPRKPVDLPSYLGLWYEIGRYEARFERDCEAVTAEYTLRPDGLIGIVNTYRVGSLRGRPRTVHARAKVVSGSGNAKLKVSFFGPLFLGNYWVLDHADDYSWSIVGEPGGTYLWLLCRDPLPSNAVWLEVLGRVDDLGYNIAMIRRTQQAKP